MGHLTKQYKTKLMLFSGCINLQGHDEVLVLKKVRMEDSCCTFEFSGCQKSVYLQILNLVPL